MGQERKPGDLGELCGVVALVVLGSLLCAERGTLNQNLLGSVSPGVGLLSLLCGSYSLPTAGSW
jgi:hypothetical protein